MQLVFARRLACCVGWFAAAGGYPGRSQGQMHGDEEVCLDAGELLARLLCQAGGGRAAEARGLLGELGYRYTLSLALCAGHVAEAGAAAAGDDSRLAAARELASQSSPVHAFDEVLPPHMLEHMRGALGRSAPYWSENGYNSPRTGFFSFQHELPPFPSSATPGAGPGGEPAATSGLDVVSALQR
jgi:hypothetical protein